MNYRKITGVFDAEKKELTANESGKKIERKVCHRSTTAKHNGGGPCHGTKSDVKRLACRNRQRMSVNSGAHKTPATPRKKAARRGRVTRSEPKTEQHKISTGKRKRPPFAEQPQKSP